MLDFQNHSSLMGKKDCAGSITSSPSLLSKTDVGKMNQEQVDAMCPEERRRRGRPQCSILWKRGDMGRKRWMDKMPFSPRTRPGGCCAWDVQDNSGKR